MESLPRGLPPVDGLSPSSYARGGEHPCELPAPRPEASNDEDHACLLARTIEQEIIPRLIMAHRAIPQAPAAGPSPSEGQELPIAFEDIEFFAKLVLSPDEDMSTAAIRTYRSRGMAIERLYLELLAPTARYLGDLWVQDLCSFSDVTIGLGRLQRVLRELSPSFGHGVGHPINGRRILLLPAPGEQHTFGLVMVSEFFRRAGWDVEGGAWMIGSTAPRLVRNEWFDVVGFSLATALHLPSLARSIAEVRAAACNPAIVVIVGGPLFGDHPEYVDVVGADGVTIDASRAPQLAECLIESRPVSSVTRSTGSRKMREPDS